MDRTIAPGATEKVTLTVNTGNATGKFTKSIRVSTNDRAKPQAGLTAVVNVTSAVTLDPPILHVGAIDRDSTEAVVRTVQLKRGSAGPIAPKLRPATAKFISSELKEITPGDVYELTVTLAPPWPNHAIATQVAFDTGVAESPLETLSVMAQVPPRLSIVPAMLMLDPNAIAEQSASLEARLIWNGKTRGKVTEATVNDDQLQVDVQQDGETPAIVLRVPAGYQVRKGAATRITIKTDDPAVPSYVIPVTSAANLPSPAAVRRSTPGAPAKN